MLKKKSALVLLLFCSFLATTQAQSDKKAIKAVINQFFIGLSTSDTTLIKSTCTEKPILQTYMKGKTGQLKVTSLEFSKFVAMIGTPSKNKLFEDIKFKAINLEQELATVWTPYTFYVNDKVSHCGTNAFQLVKTTEGWKIQYILDTRRKECDGK
jgi:hypothetical protein